MTNFKTLLAAAALAIAFPAPTCTAQARPLALTPDLCGIHGNDGVWHNITAAETRRIQKYCDDRTRKAIASDPGSYVLGRIEKADPVQGDPNSKFYHWIKSLDAEPNASNYFDARSDIGKKILKVCYVNSVCALRISIRKSWELNLDHATFWIAKVSGVTRMGSRQ